MDQVALKIKYDLMSEKLIYSTIKFNTDDGMEVIERALGTNEVDVVSLTIDRDPKDYDFWTYDYGSDIGNEIVPSFYMSFRDVFTTIVYGWEFVISGLSPDGAIVGLNIEDVSYIQEELKIWNV